MCGERASYAIKLSMRCRNVKNFRGLLKCFYYPQISKFVLILIRIINGEIRTHLQQRVMYKCKLELLGIVLSSIGLLYPTGASDILSYPLL